MRFPIALAAALLAAGCYSVEDVRERPPVWSDIYAMPYDELANCITAQSAQNYSPAPQIYLREKRAVVTITNKSAPQVIAEFQLSEATPTTSRVVFHQMPTMFNRDGGGGRKMIAACAQPAA